MRGVGLTMHVSTKLNRSHLVHGRDALILPCLGRTEADVTEAGPQSVSVEDSMSMVHLTRGTNPPADPGLPGEPTLVLPASRKRRSGTTDPRIGASSPATTPRSATPSPT